MNVDAIRASLITSVKPDSIYYPVAAYVFDGSALPEEYPLLLCSQFTLVVVNYATWLTPEMFKRLCELPIESTFTNLIVVALVRSFRPRAMHPICLVHLCAAIEPRVPIMSSKARGICTSFAARYIDAYSSDPKILSTLTALYTSLTKTVMDGSLMLYLASNLAINNMMVKPRLTTDAPFNSLLGLDFITARMLSDILTRPKICTEIDTASNSRITSLLPNHANYPLELVLFSRACFIVGNAYPAILAVLEDMSLAEPESLLTYQRSRSPSIYQLDPIPRFRMIYHFCFSQGGALFVKSLKDIRYSQIHHQSLRLLFDSITGKPKSIAKGIHANTTDIMPHFMELYSTDTIKRGMIASTRDLLPRIELTGFASFLIQTLKTSTIEKHILLENLLIHVLPNCVSEVNKLPECVAFLIAYLIRDYQVNTSQVLDDFTMDFVINALNVAFPMIPSQVFSNIRTHILSALLESKEQVDFSDSERILLAQLTEPIPFNVTKSLQVAESLNTELPRLLRYRDQISTNTFKDYPEILSIIRNCESHQRLVDMIYEITSSLVFNKYESGLKNEEQTHNFWEQVLTTAIHTKSENIISNHIVPPSLSIEYLCRLLFEGRFNNLLIGVHPWSTTFIDPEAIFALAQLPVSLNWFYIFPLSELRQQCKNLSEKHKLLHSNCRPIACWHSKYSSTQYKIVLSQKCIYNWLLSFLIKPKEATSKCGFFIQYKHKMEHTISERLMIEIQKLKSDHQL